MIPTTRTYRFGLLALLIIVLGYGADWSVFVAWGLVAGVFAGFLLDCWLAANRPQFRLERTAPLQLHVGQPHFIEWLIENRSPFPMWIQLRDQAPLNSLANPGQLEATVPPQSRTSVSYDVVATERGDTTFGDLTYRMMGPLRLARIQKCWPAKQEVRVMPHLANWKAAELAERNALVRQSGSHRYRWRGAGTLFESLREYSPEDDIRWLDWKATARVQRPISRNYEVERHQQVILLVDASRMMTTYCGERTKFDAVLEAAVLATRVVVDQGDSVGLVVFSDEVDAYLHPRRDRTQLRAVMDALYARYPRLVEPNFESALTMAAIRNRRRSLMILFTDVTVVETAERMMAYVRSLTPRHLPLLVTIADETVEQLEVREPQTTEELYQVGVANELTHQRATILEKLRHGGADILDSSADKVAAETVERYFSLKRRLRL